MKKAFSSNRALIALTCFFMLIAAFSFAAFHKAEDFCSEARNCAQPLPSKSGGEMLWDGFSRRFVSMISIK